MPGSKILAVVDNRHKVVVVFLDPLHFLGSNERTELVPRAKVTTSETSNVEPAHYVFDCVSIPMVERRCVAL